MATWQLGRNYQEDPSFAIEDALRAKAADEARRRYFADNPGNENATSVRDRAIREAAIKGGYHTPEMESAVPSARQSQIQAKAQLDASQFEMRYTAKQKAMIASNNATIAAARSSGRWSEPQLRRLEEMVTLKNLDISPTMQPRVSEYPPGQGEGESWQDQGVQWYREGGIKKPLPIKGTPQELALKQENSVLIQRLKSQSKLDENLIKEAAKPIASGTSTEGVPDMRQRTPAEQRMFLLENGATFITPTEEEARELQAKQEKAGRAAITAQRTEAGLPAAPQAGQPQPQQPQGKNAAAVGAANAVIQAALTNPDRMKSDPSFAAQARAARKFLEQQ